MCQNACFCNIRANGGKKSNNHVENEQKGCGIKQNIFFTQNKIYVCPNIRFFIYSLRVTLSLVVFNRFAQIDTRGSPCNQFFDYIILIIKNL